MKEDETRERHDKTGGVIAIDLSAVSVTVWEEAEERRETNGGQKKIKRRGSQVSANKSSLSTLKGERQFNRGFVLHSASCCELHWTFFINLWHAKSEEWVHPQSASSDVASVCVCVGGGGVRLASRTRDLRTAIIKWTPAVCEGVVISVACTYCWKGRLSV